MILLSCFLASILQASDSVTIQKTVSGEVQIRKSERSTSMDSPGQELEIEVLSPEQSPRIEVNSQPKGALVSLPQTSSSVPPKKQNEPIQITIREGIAFIVWLGKEYQVPLDSQGRFNLQIDPS